MVKEGYKEGNRGYKTSRIRPFRKIGTSSYIKLEPSDISDLNINIKKDGMDINDSVVIKDHFGNPIKEDEK